MGSVDTLARALVRFGCAAFAAGATTSCAAEYVMVQTANFPEPFIYHDALEWTNGGSEAFNTMHDFESAKEAAYGSIGQLEGLHLLVPEDQNGLFLLNRSWAGIAFAFIDDEREEAMVRKDEEDEEYQKARARAAFRRARFYGEELLRQRFSGYEQAQRNADTLKAWLRENYTDPELAKELMWLGFAIIGRVNFDQDNPAAVAELWVGVSMLERSIELDETVEHGTAHTILGAYDAAFSRLDESKRHFDRAMQISGNKVLSARLNLASRYYCMKRDKQNYLKNLQAVIDAGDPLPEERLQNAISQRRARRYLTYPAIFQEECAFEG